MNKRLASAEERILHAKLADEIEAFAKNSYGIDPIGVAVEALRRFAATGTLAPPPGHRDPRQALLTLLLYKLMRTQDGMSHEKAVTDLADRIRSAERTVERALARARKMPESDKNIERALAEIKKRTDDK